MNQILNNPTPKMNRGASQSDKPEVMTDIYKDDVNIAIWQRSLSSELLNAAERIITLNRQFKFSASISLNAISDVLYKELGKTPEAKLISADVSEVADMFCYLFDLDRVGLRLATLDQAMCPKFHVDRVPCRLVSTYSGVATQWLSHSDVNRKKLGIGSNGLPDDQSGLYLDNTDIHQLSCGDVGLLKGESWVNNEGGGLVHRSPDLTKQKKRLLLTLDFN